MGARHQCLPGRLRERRQPAAHRPDRRRPDRCPGSPGQLVGLGAGECHRRRPPGAARRHHRPRRPGYDAVLRGRRFRSGPGPTAATTSPSVRSRRSCRSLSTSWRRRQAGSSSAGGATQRHRPPTTPNSTRSSRRWSSRTSRLRPAGPATTRSHRSAPLSVAVRGGTDMHRHTRNLARGGDRDVNRDRGLQCTTAVDRAGSSVASGPVVRGGPAVRGRAQDAVRRPARGGHLPDRRGGRRRGHAPHRVGTLTWGATSESTATRMAS